MDLSDFTTTRHELKRPLLVISGSKGVLACGYLDIDTFEKLDEAGAIVNIQGPKGNTPLHAACLAGHAHVVRALLRRGAYVNSANGDKETVLMTAALGGRTDVVELLLELGADPNLLDVDGRDAQGIAAANGHNDTAAILRRAARRNR